MQILPAEQSLEYLQVSLAGVQAPLTQVRPLAQSFEVVQGQGPLVPPHGSHWLATQALPAGQSAVVVHPFVVPGGWLGGTQSPALHTSPLGQSESAWQLCSHPLLVQVWPLGHPALPVQGEFGGGFTELQP